VGDVDRIKNVANIIREDVEKGHQVAVVVSARSGVTNELIARATAINEQPDEREMDVLLAVGEQETIALTAMALHALGIEAISMTGAQAGIKTDPAHTRARIKSMNCEKIVTHLEKGSVVIVAGFQGVNDEGTTTTLGRGGSDLSAIALASGLNADLCQIYTDVDGVYTADPRIVPNASKIQEISYEEMLEMASLGTKVMQARSVEFANKYNVVFEVRSSFDTSIPGTIVKQEVSSMEDVVVRGVALDRNQAKIMVSNIPDKPGSAAQIFEALGSSNVVVDMIVQNIAEDGCTDFTFTVHRNDYATAYALLETVSKELGAKKVKGDDAIVKISLVGVGMRSHAGIANTMFDTLAKENINISMISTSEIKISVVVDEKYLELGVRSLHEAFGLDSDGHLKNL